MITIEKKYIYLFYLVNIKPKDGHKHRKVILSSIGNLQHWLSISFAAEGYNKWKDCVGKYVLPSLRPCSTAQSWSGKRSLISTVQSSLKTLPISIRIQIPWDKIIKHLAPSVKTKQWLLRVHNAKCQYLHDGYCNVRKFLFFDVPIKSSQ